MNILDPETQNTFREKLKESEQNTDLLITCQPWFTGVTCTSNARH